MDTPGAHKEMDPWMAWDNTPALWALFLNWDDMGLRTTGGTGVTPNLWVQAAFGRSFGVPWGDFYKHRALFLSPRMLCFKSWAPGNCAVRAYPVPLPPREVLFTCLGLA